MNTFSYDLTSKRVFVAGHRGMAGSAIARRLQRERCTVLTADRTTLDLSDAARTMDWMRREKPNVVVLAAARVGGIKANDDFPDDFLRDNLAIELSVIGAAHACKVERLLFLGSSCIYPKHAPQPIPEELLLTGPLEPTNEWYAIAKIAGLKMCQALRRQHGNDFIAVMPTNLYGPGDNYHPEHSHVMAALLRRFHEAKAGGAESVAVWGTGTPRREFLFVDDLADACVFLLKHYSGEMALNIGTGHDIAIADLAARIAATVGYDGRIVFDTTKPDGTPRKLLDVSRMMALGWCAETPLDDGLRLAYGAFLRGEGRNLPPT